MPDFSCRTRELELMDDPSISADEMHATLDELAFINRTLGGYRPSLIGLKRLLPKDCSQLRILDVGTGGGDTPHVIQRWAKRRGIDTVIVGIDLSATAVGYARAKWDRLEGVSFEQIDVFDLESQQPFDVVHSALTLHHFEAERLTPLLKKMYNLSRLGMIVNDLQRHPLAYHSIRALTRCFSRSRLIRHDAPLSVLRAFHKADLVEAFEAAGLPAPHISWHWAFRWLAVLSKEPTLTTPAEARDRL